MALAVMGACGAGEGLELMGTGSCPTIAEACILDYSKPQFPLLSLMPRDLIYWALEAD